MSSSDEVFTVLHELFPIKRFVGKLNLGIGVS